MVLALLLLLAAGGALYVNTYSRATPEADRVASRAIIRDGNLLFPAENAEEGIILYPGGKVDEKAYAPLARALNKKGYYVVIARMPLRLAILDSGRAKRIMDELPDIQDWYLVGHSLGGTSASMFVKRHPDRIAGIVFLASYPYPDLSGWQGKSLTILGSNDQVLSRDKMEAASYPQDAASITIQGGNHAGFGDYGAQKGDGPTDISGSEQMKKTADAIEKFIQQPKNTANRRNDVGFFNAPMESSEREQFAKQRKPGWRGLRLSAMIAREKMRIELFFVFPCNPNLLVIQYYI